MNIAAFFVLLAGLYIFWKKSPLITGLFFLLLILPVGMWLSRPAFLYERFWVGLLPFIFLIIAEGLLGISEQKVPGKIIAVAMALFMTGGSLLSLAGRQSPMIDDASWSLREELHAAEKMVGENAPVYALKGHDRFFRYYLHHPVIALDTEADYTRVIEQNAHPAFFVLPRLIRSASYSSRPILARLKASAREQKVGDLSIFIP